MVRQLDLSQIPLGEPLLDIIGVQQEVLYEIRTTLSIPESHMRKCYKILDTLQEELGGLIELARKRSEQKGVILYDLSMARMGYKETGSIHYIENNEDFETLFDTAYPGWSTRYVYLFRFKPIAECDPREIADSEL